MKNIGIIKKVMVIAWLCEPDQDPDGKFTLEQDLAPANGLTWIFSVLL
jgi:hypothetical protein